MDYVFKFFGRWVDKVNFCIEQIIEVPSIRKDRIAFKQCINSVVID